MLKHLKPEGFLCASEEETFCFSYYYVGRVLLMLGKLQFELQKLVDKYVSFSDLVQLIIFPLSNHQKIKYTFFDSAVSYIPNDHNPLRVTS